MKQIAFTIEPFHIDNIKAAIMTIGVSGLTIYHVQTYAPRFERIDSFRGVQYLVDHEPELAVELVVDDFKVEQVVHAIRHATRGHRGCEGVIAILSIDET